MATLRLEIVTPERIAYAEDVEMVTLPGSEGELGVYPKHVPVLTILKPGEVRVVKDKRASSLAVGEGFIEITRARSTRHYRRQRRLPAGPRARGTSSRRSEDSRSCFRRGDRSGTWSARR